MSHLQKRHMEPDHGSMMRLGSQFHTSEAQCLHRRFRSLIFAVSVERLSAIVASVAEDEVRLQGTWLKPSTHQNSPLGLWSDLWGAGLQPGPQPPHDGAAYDDNPDEREALGLRVVHTLLGGRKDHSPRCSGLKGLRPGGVLCCQASGSHPHSLTDRQGRIRGAGYSHVPLVWVQAQGPIPV